MARARRAPPPPTTAEKYMRRFVVVDRETFLKFHARWREIDRTWSPLGDPEHWDAVAGLRAAAREELREEIRRDARMNVRLDLSEGSYVVPV